MFCCLGFGALFWGVTAEELELEVQPPDELVF